MDGTLIARGPRSNIYRLKTGQIRKDLQSITQDKGLPSLFEIELQHTLHHPYLLSREGIEVKDDCISLYLPGAQEDLLDATNHGYSQEEMLPFFYHISLALLELHKNHIIHLDVKPDNILIFQNGDERIAKLADFGHARYLTPETQLMYPLGTPLYFSPEFLDATIKGKKTLLNASVDVWSLGLTFFLVMTREFNYDLDEDGEIVSLSAFADKTQRFWIMGDRQYYLQRKINHSKIANLLSNMLTSVEKRWSMERVVFYLELIFTGNPIKECVITTGEIPSHLQKKIKKYMKCLGMSYYTIKFWLSCLLPRINIKYDDEIIVVLIYILASYTGKAIDIKPYLGMLRSPLTVTRFIEIEVTLVKQLYPQRS